MLVMNRSSIGWPVRTLLFFYNLLWHIALPIALLRLYWKGRHQPAYRKNISERLGCYSKSNFLKSPVWLHAVSVGETRACEPLVKALIQSGEQVVLTHMTPTGRQTGEDIFASFIQSGQLVQVYLPYDVSWAIHSFLKTFQPKLGLLMETEVWPGLVFLSSTQFPLVLVNARLSARSARRFAKFGFVANSLFGSFSRILAQTPIDAKHFEGFQSGNVEVTGNLKFDVLPNTTQIESALRVKEQSKPGTRIICAASTREGEELVIAKAWKELSQREPELISSWRLLIVPRHPQRFLSVNELLLSESLNVQKRSDLDELGLAQALDRHSVILGDSMGEMSFYYALSDVVVMGGSLLPLGGQNFIEACALGCPIILGEHTFNFHQASMDAIDAGAAIRIASLAQLAGAMGVVMKDISALEEMSSHAIDYAGQHMGATQKTIHALKEYL